eukprot:684766-Prorocentrum_minimum.AAC.3
MGGATFRPNCVILLPLSCEQPFQRADLCTCAMEKSRVMLVAIPSLSSCSHALNISHVEASLMRMRSLDTPMSSRASTCRAEERRTDSHSALSTEKVEVGKAGTVLQDGSDHKLYLSGNKAGDSLRDLSSEEAGDLVHRVAELLFAGCALELAVLDGLVDQVLVLWQLGRLVNSHHMSNNNNRSGLGEEDGHMNVE